MPTKPLATKRQIAAHGIVIEVFVPGAFYQGCYPGGFTDALTGLHIPGPKAILDGSTNRRVVSYVDIPEPVQVFFTKMKIKITDSGKTREEVEVPFNTVDDVPVHEGLQNALDTGVIRIVPDEVMMEKYPMTWASRKESYCYYPENAKPPKDVRELLEEAENEGKYQRHATKITSAVKDAQQQLAADLAGNHQEPETEEQSRPKPPLPKRI